MIESAMILLKSGGSHMKRIIFLTSLGAVAVCMSVNWASARPGKPASDPLELLPDGNAVVIIDFQKIAGSSLWATISEMDKFKGALERAQSEIAGLGLKLNNVHTVALVFPAASLNNPTVALTGVFEQSDLLARLRAGGKVKLTSEKYKGFDIYKTESIPSVAPSKEPNKAQASTKAKPATRGDESAVNKGTSFIFYDSNTIVAGSLEAVRASVDVRTGVTPGVVRDAKLAGALAQSPTAAVRFAVAVTPAMTKGLQSSELPIPDFSSVELIFGWIDVASGIDLNATLRSDTADHAKSIADRLSSLLAMAKGFLGSMSDPKMVPIVEALKTVNITSADVDVRITGTVPIDLLNSLLTSGRKAQ
jgi:hypothetical protein